MESHRRKIWHVVSARAPLLVLLFRSRRRCINVLVATFLRAFTFREKYVPAPFGSSFFSNFALPQKYNWNDAYVPKLQVVNFVTRHVSI